jgi:hypothetical protein
VSEIGIRVAHLNDGRPFDYGLDNWQWSIPEPGAAWMAGVALLSGGLLLGPRLWRRRRDPPSAE